MALRPPMRRFQEDGLQPNERSLSADIASEKALKNAKDVLLEETAHIVVDMSDLMKTASAAKPQ